MELNKESYYSLLESRPWRAFRHAFFKKKGYTCERCHRHLERGLVVHHKRYFAGHKPWEYADDDLQCLCTACHQAVHVELNDRGLKIPVYDSHGAKLLKIPDSQKCYNCAGTGFIEEFPYYLGGICFRCFGTGMRKVHRYTADEARRYGQRFYNQWRARRENHNGEIEDEWSRTFTCAEDAQRWFLEMNDKQ